jgi:hypothetical protein
VPFVLKTHPLDRPAGARYKPITKCRSREIGRIPAVLTLQPVFVAPESAPGATDGNQGKETLMYPYLAMDEEVFLAPESIISGVLSSEWDEFDVASIDGLADAD